MQQMSATAQGLPPPHRSSVQTPALLDCCPGFFHAEKLCPTWSITAHLLPVHLLLQAGEEEQSFLLSQRAMCTHCHAGCLPFTLSWPRSPAPHGSAEPLPRAAPDQQLFGAGKWEPSSAGHRPTMGPACGPRPSGHGEGVHGGGEDTSAKGTVVNSALPQRAH